MAVSPSHRWLGVAGAVTLALAALVLVFAWQRHAEERRAAEDVAARAGVVMNQLEAEAARMERAAAADEGENATHR